MKSGTKKKTRLEKTAFHEAGHAAMAILQRRAFRYVTIMPGEDSLGKVIFNQFSESFQSDADAADPEFIRPRIEKLIMTSLAGNAAEKIFSGRYNNIGASQDSQNAFSYAGSVCMSEKESGFYIAWLSVRTERMLSLPFNWVCIEAIAKKLLEQNRLSYRATRAIFMEARERFKAK